MDEINWGPSGEDVYNRTYSRTKPDGTKETWPETVNRVVDGNLMLVPPFEGESDEYLELKRLMENFSILPAGRHLWASGVKGRQFLFNCWHSGWGDKVSDHFEFTFLRLMEGGGVGATYSTEVLDKYGPVKRVIDVHVVCDNDHQDYETMKEAGLLSSVYSPDYQGSYHEVEDSREGWAAALVELLESAWVSGIPKALVFDVSRVRPSGSRLKTFGGHASGPEPLARMLLEIGSVLMELAPGKFFDETTAFALDPISAMEIDHSIAQCVVAGGNRRSARMSIMPWDDPYIHEFIRLKEDTDKHWTTNISVQVDDEFFRHLDEFGRANGWSKDPDAVKASVVLRAVAEGMLNNGEPGIWNKSLSNVGEVNPVTSTNPCLTGDTVIATLDGPRTFKELAESGEDVLVHAWHPETKTPVIRWMRNPRLTRKSSPVLEITFDSGLKVRATPDHNFYSFRGEKVEAQYLVPGQSVRAWSMSSVRPDEKGGGHLRVHGWDSVRNKASHQWVHRMVWENEFGPIADGLIVNHLNEDPTDNNVHNLSLMTEKGHNRFHYPSRHANGLDGTCKNHKVVSVEYAGTSDVYNGTVDDAHSYIVLDPEPVAGIMSGIVSANCGEIPLPEWGACVLGHINLEAFAPVPGLGGRPVFDLEGAIRAARLMTRFLIRATFGDIQDEKARKVMDRDRRIGVGLFGFQAAFAKMGIPFSKIPESSEAEDILETLKMNIRDEAETYAFQLRIPVPIKVTTVAPTGTIAKMPGTTEGIHPIFARHFIRRIRFSTLDESQVRRLEEFREQGYHVEPDQYAANTMVVEIPTRERLVDEVVALGYDASVVESADEIALVDMLEVQALVQSAYADNAISFTVNLDPSKYTADILYPILKKYLPYLKGTTVFPDQSRPQAPYERISEAEFDLYQFTQIGEGVDEDCASGACPVR